MVNGPSFPAYSPLNYGTASDVVDFEIFATDLPSLRPFFSSAPTKRELHSLYQAEVFSASCSPPGLENGLMLPSFLISMKILAARSGDATCLREDLVSWALGDLARRELVFPRKNRVWIQITRFPVIFASLLVLRICCRQKWLSQQVCPRLFFLNLSV